MPPLHFYSYILFYSFTKPFSFMLVADCLLDVSGVMGTEKVLEYCDNQIKEALEILSQPDAAGEEAVHGALVRLNRLFKGVNGFY